MSGPLMGSTRRPWGGGPGPEGRPDQRLPAERLVPQLDPAPGRRTTVGLLGTAHQDEYRRDLDNDDQDPEDRVVVVPHGRVAARQIRPFWVGPFVVPEVQHRPVVVEGRPAGEDAVDRLGVSGEGPELGQHQRRPLSPCSRVPRAEKLCEPVVVDHRVSRTVAVGHRRGGFQQGGDNGFDNRVPLVTRT